ncbi:hypothetical protein [Hymenobacter negativus]|uniref:Gluconate 2-dehydrogenase subunit 3 family protein n=1 Tax=Hymenobacter negativus TaxID=2795026 RepID=A0ABS3QHX3_9BACT|nr:hypothetical protein [Hymenobacter negativus]MBO2010845.1 hypothetical protein [Hymenobacter negativus]
MKLLITKFDLPDYVKFTSNTADSLINPDIRDAHEFDVLPLLTPAEVQVVATYVGYQQAVAAFQVMTEADQATHPLTPEQLAYAAYLTLPEAEQPLDVLYKPYQFYRAVRGLLCHESYRRFLLSHGLHQTPNGFEVISDGGHQPISNQQRTELRGDAQAKCATYRSRLLVTQRAFSGVPIATTCPSSTQRPGNGGLMTYAV